MLKKNIPKEFSIDKKKPENLNSQAFFLSDLDGTEFEPLIGRFKDFK